MIAKNGEYVTLGELRDYINNECENFNDDIPVLICIKSDLAVACKDIICDEEGFNIYDYE